MAFSNWKNLFGFAIQSLDFEEGAQDIYSVKLKSTEKYFVWLKEIPEEIEKRLCSSSSTKLNPLPKTPAVKRRAQTRARLKAIQENDNDDTPNEQETKEIIVDKSILTDDSPKGRPKRERKRPTTSAAANGVRKLRSSRNPTVSVTRLTPREIAGEQDVSVTKKTKKNHVDHDENTCESGSDIKDQLTDDDDKGGGGDDDDNAGSLKKKKSDCKSEAGTVGEDIKLPVDCETLIVKSKATTCHVGLGETKDRQSPSVRDRAQAYEVMLTQKITSPVKSQRPLTPSSAGRNFASATVSSLAKASPKHVSIVDKCSLSAKCSPRISRLSRKSASRRSRRSSRRSSRSDSGRLTAPVKPSRSKLALKKKSVESVPHPVECDKENLLTPKMTGDISSRSRQSSRDSALSSVSSTSQKYSQSQDEMSDKGDTSSEDEGLPSVSNGQDKMEADESGELNETHVVITEVFNVEADGRQDLVEYEKVETKTTPVIANRVVAESPEVEDSSKDSSTAEENRTFTKESPQEPAAPARSTRTRARALLGNANASAESQPKESESAVAPANSFTDLKVSSSSEDTVQKSDEELPRTTRTRARVQKQQESDEQEQPVSEVRSTRTRSRQTEATKNVTESSVRDVSVLSNAQKVASRLSAETQGQTRSTRSRMRLVEAESGGFDEVVAGSPAIKSYDMRASKKRPVEEYGNSPLPKRSRSCAGMPAGNSTFNTQSILLTSSPRRGNVEDEEIEDTVDTSLMSPARQCPRPYTFNSSQKAMSISMKRTPAFAKTTSKVYSFLGNTTPTHNNSKTLTSFLKRNTPTSKNSHQVLQEQKMQRLQEKEKKEKERLRRAAEMKKQKLEEQKRLRDDRLRKVAETREMKLRQELEQKERINRKFEDKAVLKDRMLEEKLKAETEKKEMRERKQMEANSRRRQEEEERNRKHAEMEEEARRQQEWMQRKKEFEEEERKKHVEEEKRKQEDRQQKMLEEKARLKRQEEEKKERMRKERDRQLALEKAEKDRIEREKREERDRKEEQRRREEQKRMEEKKRAEEQEKIKAMEAAHRRAQEEALRLQKEREAKKAELQKLISQCKSGAGLNTSNTTSTNSYSLTPDAKKVYKPSPNPNNYDITDKVSDDSTDEEDAPKKKIPDWAMGVPLNTALIRQHTHPPDVKAIFRPHLVEAPDLAKLFPRSRQRHKFHCRTSSAIWTSPAMKN